MSNRFPTLLFFAELYEQIKKDPIQDWAAQLAFYFLLAIFPLLIFILALLPYLPIDVSQVYEFVEEYVPFELADLFITTVLELVVEPKISLLSFGILGTIWSASNGINALIRALNKAHNIDETRSFFVVRLLSIVLMFGLVIVFIVTLLLPIFGRLILEAIDAIFHMPYQSFILWNRLRWVIGIVIMTVVLMFVYMIAPNRKLSFKDVLYGAIFATVSWQLISLGFSIYVTNFANFSATYGSLGGVIILMFWFFLSGLILVIGGQINATLQNLKHRTKTH